MTTTPSALGRSEVQIHDFQQAFKLSYHFNYLQVCQKFEPLQGLDVLEMGTALPASLVINHFSWNIRTGFKATTPHNQGNCAGKQ